MSKTQTRHTACLSGETSVWLAQTLHCHLDTRLNSWYNPTLGPLVRCLDIVFRSRKKAKTSRPRAKYWTFFSVYSNLQYNKGLVYQISNSISIYLEHSRAVQDIIECRDLWILSIANGSVSGSASHKQVSFLSDNAHARHSWTNRRTEMGKWALGSCSDHRHRLEMARKQLGHGGTNLANSCLTTIYFLSRHAKLI